MRAAARGGEGLEQRVKTMRGKARVYRRRALMSVPRADTYVLRPDEKIDFIDLLCGLNTGVLRIT